MSEQQKSESYQAAFDALRKISQNMTDLSTADLSKIHVSQDWSFVPHLKDHLDFLIEQVEGLIINLQDAPPPDPPQVPHD